MKAKGRQRWTGVVSDLSAAIKPFVKATGAAFVDYSESPSFDTASMCVELLVKEKDIIVAMRKVGKHITQKNMLEAVAALAPSHFTPPAKNSWSLCMSRRLRNMLHHVEIAEQRPSPPKWFIENFLEAAPSAAASSGGETSSGRKQVDQQTPKKKAAKKLPQKVDELEGALVVQGKAKTDAGTDWLYGWNEQLNKPERRCATNPNRVELGVVVPKPADQSDDFVLAKFGHHVHKLKDVTYQKAHSAAHSTKAHSQPGPLWEGEHGGTHNTLKISQRMNQGKLVLSLREQQRQRHQVVIDAFGPVDTKDFLPDNNATLQLALGVLVGLAERYAKDKITIGELKAECTEKVKAAKEAAKATKAEAMKAMKAEKAMRAEAMKTPKPMKVSGSKNNTYGEMMKKKVAARLAGRNTPTMKGSKTMATAMKTKKVAARRAGRNTPTMKGSKNMDLIVQKRLREMPKMNFFDADMDTSESYSDSD